MSGDLAVCFVLASEGQKLLQTFKDIDLEICKEELQWIQNYRLGEYKSNADLMLDKQDDPEFKYKVYTLPLTFNLNNNKHIKTYPQYLINAGIAKGNVGERDLYSHA